MKYRMKNFYDINNKRTCDPYIKDIQTKLNSIRETFHYSWERLTPDGIYGIKTKAVVMAFQKIHGITPASGILGPTTSQYIISINKKNQIRQISEQTYGIVSKTVNNIYKIDSIVNKDEKNLAYILEEWKKIIIQQHDNLIRRLKKIPINKRMRARNIIKQLEYCKDFISKTKAYGINVSVRQFSNNLTKEKAIEYIKEIGETITNSPLTKGLTAITRSFEKIKKIIEPIIKVLNKIPGLKYLSVIEKLVKATKKMFQYDFEGAFKLYLDALRELFEQIIIDATVTATLAAGGWLALVIAIVVIIGSMFIDHYFFSDKEENNLILKHASLNYIK